MKGFFKPFPLFLLTALLILTACGGGSSKGKPETQDTPEIAAPISDSETEDPIDDSSDTKPNAFNFTAQTGVQRGVYVVSNTLTITGINSATEITIQNGEYAIGENDTFISTSGMISNNQMLKVRLMSSEEFSTETQASITIGGVESVFSAKTEEVLSVPNAFEFTPQLDVALNTDIDAPAIVVSGINTDVPISVVNGLYAIGNNPFTDKNGTIKNGESVVLRARSSDQFLTAVETELHIGTRKAIFKITTESPARFSPEVNITFPPNKSFTTHDKVLIKGTTTPSDETSVTSVNVNGVAASSSDNFATWQAEIALESGLNHLTVNAENSLAATYENLAELELIYQPAFFSRPQSMAFDKDGNSVFLFDFATREKAILSIDLETGTQSVVSDIKEVANPRVIEFDPKRNKVVIIAYQKIFTMDATTGETTELEVTLPEGSDLNFSNMVMDIARDQILYFDRVNDRLLAIDLEGGNASIIDEENPDDSHRINSYSGIGFDAVNSRFLIMRTGSNWALISIDITSGKRNIISEKGLPNSNNALLSSVPTIAVDPAGQYAYITNSSLGSIFRVDLENGERELVLGLSTQSKIFKPVDILLNEKNNHLIIADEFNESLVSLDLASGELNNVSDSFDNDIIGSVFYPGAADFDELNDQLLLREFNLASIELGFSSISHNNEEHTFTAVGDPSNYRAECQTLDEKNKILYFYNGRRDRLMALNLATSNQTEVSSSKIAGENPISNCWDMVLDEESQRLLLVNDHYKGIMSIDIASGERHLISDNTRANSGDNIERPYRLATDFANQRIFVLDIGQNSVVEVDLNSGTRQLISSPSIPNSDLALSSPRSLLYDETNDRLLVTDNDLGALLAIDITNGERSILSANSDENTELNFKRTSDIARLDMDSVIVSDASAGHILTINLHSGARDILTQVANPEMLSFDRASQEILASNNFALFSYSFEDKQLSEMTPQAIAQDIIDFDIYDESEQVVALTANGSLINTHLRSSTTNVLVKDRNQLGQPNNLFVYEADNNVILLGRELDIFSYNLESGAINQTELENNTDFSAGKGFAYSGNPNEAVIGGYYSTNNDPGLIRVNWETGKTQVITRLSDPDMGIDIERLGHLTIDEKNQIAYVVDEALHAIISVNLANGKRSIISDNATNIANPIPENTHSLVLDAERKRLLLTIENLRAIMAIDLSDGQRIYQVRN